eukprot:GHVU01128998.1.p2 GENE.GHVU01128998.1~~GHVU01128998.1.p2  ORF type:complete len:109 (-),score=5.71 GHVU01128998.1:1730-2056(-)
MIADRDRHVRFSFISEECQLMTYAVQVLQLHARSVAVQLKGRAAANASTILSSERKTAVCQSMLQARVAVAANTINLLLILLVDGKNKFRTSTNPSHAQRRSGYRHRA